MIVGLGNPGEGYAKTRHNVGFRVLDALAGRDGIWKTKCLSSILQSEIAEHPVLLAKPLTYMNLSGGAVKLLLQEYRLEPGQLLIVLDDLNLPFGRIRIRSRGSAGGHNGLESVLRTLGSAEVSRVRVGIGEEDLPADKAKFVLADFPPERDREVDALILRAVSAVEAVLRDGLSQAMAVFNA